MASFLSLYLFSQLTGPEYAVGLHKRQLHKVKSGTAIYFENQCIQSLGTGVVCQAHEPFSYKSTLSKSTPLHSALILSIFKFCSVKK